MFLQVCADVFSHKISKQNPSNYSKLALFLSKATNQNSIRFLWIPENIKLNFSFFTKSAVKSLASSLNISAHLLFFLESRQLPTLIVTPNNKTCSLVYQQRKYNHYQREMHSMHLGAVGCCVHSYFWCCNPPYAHSRTYYY